ncbi:MAG: flagellar basal body P-ring protein FlgI [Dechloromonas sp.]|uniref:Flagellar P-ring protein n=1 Tax=Candidatus Dechloromonas phosphorivorans TaxID=2899244 RepID=A0A9D7LWC6_9RHOO|nr:flagellar basal body P-ring protein FlgI [Candidatus Dechloromonas phosphorivorans]
MNRCKKCSFALLLTLCIAGNAQAERIKDLVSIQGVRGNQLIGHGLVVGLDGSGDQTTQTPFTVQSVINMLTGLGISLPVGVNLQLKNIAAVMVTASLPAFARPGQTIDVTTSSMGNAKSLRGGTLLMTPLRGADGEIYAVAQGNVLVGGVGASSASGSSSVQVNHLNVGRISAGATVERSVPTELGQGDYVNLELNSTDFGTAKRIVDVINARVFAGTAEAVDGRQIKVRAPLSADERVMFLARIESLEVTPTQASAKVIVNARTGSVVMNQTVMVEQCAVAHGNLTVEVRSEPVISQPGPLSRGRTVVTENAQVDVRTDKGGLTMVKQSVSLGDVVKALNSLGATPQDLQSILQAMKAAGALRAELEVI